MVMWHRRASLAVTWRRWSSTVVMWCVAVIGGDVVSSSYWGAVKTHMHHDVAAVVGGDAYVWCSTISSPCLAQMGSDRGTQ